MSHFQLELHHRIGFLLSPVVIYVGILSELWCLANVYHNWRKMVGQDNVDLSTECRYWWDLIEATDDEDNLLQDGN
jgi:hypothetical protein